MKRLVVGLAIISAAFGMSGSVHAASGTAFVAGSVTLGDQSHISASAARSNGRAQGSLALTEGTSGANFGAVVQGRVLCLYNFGTGDAVAAVVTRSTDTTVPVGSIIASFLYTSSHRVYHAYGFRVGGYIPQPDGICSFTLSGQPFAAGYVTAGTMVAY